jgi:outer membrane protein OmpA-like peptidoglycan-associated protein
MRGRWYIGTLAIALAWCVSGCITSSSVVERTRVVEETLNKLHGPSTMCAPQPLAEAEAFLDVARYESNRGDSVLALGHVEKAEEAAMELVLAFPESKKLEWGERCYADSDMDGISDHKDRCREKPENYNGIDDEDGCPDGDADGDGISNRQDACPGQPEDRDNFEDEDGCPDLDNDEDGVPDLKDECRNQPEDRDQFEDEDGCPDPDNDQDGIADLVDKCPLEPEDFDGDQDEDGCPDIYKNIVVLDNMISLKQKVFFETDKARILPRSFEMLNEIADVLLKRPEMVVRIEGHTDSRGSQRYNQKLSNSRAKSVREYLGDQDVPGDRMKAVGFGEDRPIEDNSTEEGRAVNRRVEFHIEQK